MSFVQTHVVPASGLHSWPAPDGTSPQGPDLDPGLPVAVVQRVGDWAEIRCSNGWTAWVDGRFLQPAVSAAPAPAAPAPTPGFVASAPVPVAPAPTFVAPAPFTPAVAAVAPAAGAGGFPAARSGVAMPTAALDRVVFGAGVFAALAAFFPWVSAEFASVTAWKVPAAFLVDDGADGAPWLAWLLLGVGAAAVVLALTGRGPKMVRQLGIVMTAVGVLFAVQLLRSPGASAENVGAGAWLLIIGGVTTLVSPTILRRRHVKVGPAAVAAPVRQPSAAVPASVAAAPVWQPTHRVLAAPAACYERPDPSTRLSVHLEPGLDVRVEERLGDWVHVTCSNGWATWVDGRQLTA